MRVILAKTAGFCYGVERAVALAHETAKAHGGAMLGSVIHNANVVAELEREGMRLIASPGEAAAGETVLIRSHGESREVLEELQARGAEIVSATCPNVRHIQRLVTEAEAAELYDYLIAAGIEDGYWQEPDSSGEDMIPAFDGTGLD